MTTYGGNPPTSPPGYGVTDATPKAVKILRTLYGLLRTSEAGDREFVAKWHYKPAIGQQPTGISQQDAIRWIGSVLNDSRGWPRANVRFEYAENRGVAFCYTYETSCPDHVLDIGCVHYYEDGSRVVVLHPDFFGPGGPTEFTEVENTFLINHEAGHAFFGGVHSGTGIMEDNFNAWSHAWPDAQDIADLRSWLGIT
jgi:hypothetical protein